MPSISLAASRWSAAVLPPGNPTPRQAEATRTAELVFGYARTGHAEHGRHAQSTGLVVQAATMAAHAVLAARGEWVTNEKTLLARAGLGDLDAIVAEPDPVAAAAKAHARCADAVREAQR